MGMIGASDEDLDLSRNEHVTAVRQFPNREGIGRPINCLHEASTAESCVRIVGDNAIETGEEQSHKWTGSPVEKRRDKTVVSAQRPSLVIVTRSSDLTPGSPVASWRNRPRYRSRTAFRLLRPTGPNNRSRSRPESRPRRRSNFRSQRDQWPSYIALAAKDPRKGPIGCPHP